VYKPACHPCEYNALYICESSLKEIKHGSTPEPAEWTDNEITAIRTVLHKLTSLRIMNCNDAEDLVQDTLLTMIKKNPGSDLEKGLLVWSMGILRKKVGNYYRRVQRFTSLNDKKVPSLELSKRTTLASSPEIKVFHDELQDILDENLPLLPVAQRQAMELLLSGLDSGEVVRELHPEHYQNVINRIYRGRKRLAKVLASYGYGPNAQTGMRKMKRCVKRRSG
jgi:RNA polymerase sigma factor (sigma-70 family)